jgi:hypothetical protein
MALESRVAPASLIPYAFVVLHGLGPNSSFAAEPAEFKQLHSIIKPKSEEEKWVRIPWRTSLWEARQQAGREGKPTILWVIAVQTPTKRIADSTQACSFTSNVSRASNASPVSIWLQLAIIGATAHTHAPGRTHRVPPMGFRVAHYTNSARISTGPRAQVVMFSPHG